MNVRTIAFGTLERAVFDHPTLIISDLHMNTSGKHNNFQADLFLAFLGAYPASTWDIIDLGDHWDVWESGSLHRVISANVAVEAALSRFHRIVTLGNHDGNIDQGDIDRWLALSVVTHLADKDNYWLEHGHRLDPACSGKGRWVGRVASALWGAVERVGLGRVLGGIAAWVKRVYYRGRKTAAKRKDDNEEYITDAIGRECVLSATGHTHSPELLELPGQPGHYYANPGSWVEYGRGYALKIIGKEIKLLVITA